MGTNLTLLAYEHDGSGIEYAGTTLATARNRILYGAINELELGCPDQRVGNLDTVLTLDSPPPFNHYLTVQQLLTLWPLVDSLSGSYPYSYENRAIWAYLRECPTDLRVALYWW